MRGRASFVFGVPVLLLAIVGCGSGSPTSDAKTYVHAVSDDAHQVQNDEAQVGLDILHNDLTALARDAQTAHDDYVKIKTDVIAAGTNVADTSRLGNAENQMDDAIDELKNGMGAVVAFAEDPNGGTLGAANAKLGQGIQDWDQGATTIWTLAGVASEIPTLAPGDQTTTSTTSATTTTTATTPSTSPTSRAALSAGTRRCDGNVYADAATSCPFADNVYLTYSRAVDAGAPPPSVVTADSPVTHQTYDMACSKARGVVSCTGGNGALVRFVPSSSAAAPAALGSGFDQYSASNPYCEDGLCGYPLPSGGSCLSGYRYHPSAPSGQQAYCITYKPQ